MTALPDRFWSKVSKDSDGCWRWTGARHAQGYGTFWIDGVVQRAHRLAWADANGHMPPPTTPLLHACDTPECVNPSHLSPGDQQQNMADYLKRGAERSHLPIIERLRASGMSVRQIAAATGIPRSTVGDVVSGRTWRAVRPIS